MNCTLYEGFNPMTVSLTTTFVVDAEGVYSVQEYGPIGQINEPTFLSL
jgi:hypothetical protein